MRTVRTIMIQRFNQSFELIEMRAALKKVKVKIELVGRHRIFSFVRLCLKIKNPQLPIHLKCAANADCPFIFIQRVYALDIT